MRLQRIDDVDELSVNELRHLLSTLREEIKQAKERFEYLQVDIKKQEIRSVIEEINKRIKVEAM